MSIRCHIPLLILLASLAARTVLAQDHVAMLVANYDYGEVELSESAADVHALAETLKQRGFRVNVAENLDAKELETQAIEFADSAPTAGMALFYFGGYASRQPNNKEPSGFENLLQGAGPPADTRRLDRVSCKLNRLLEEFRERCRARHTVMLLDCGLTNPFQQSDEQPGLTPIAETQLGGNYLVAVAAPFGKTISPKPDDSHFPLAQAVGEHLRSGRESLSGLAATIVQRGDTLGASLQVDSSFLAAELPDAQNRPGTEWVNDAGIVFCWCPPGRYRMGANRPDTPALADAQPVEVTLSRGFWISKYEITLREYKLIRNRDVRDPLGKELNTAAHNVGYGNAESFCKALTEREQKARRLPKGWKYDLPTEAQWEYAARAGTDSAYHFGNDPSALAQHANFADRSLLTDDDSLQFADARWDDGVGRAVAVVGTYRPNAWGIHDMHGNVWEWCRDHYTPQLPGGADPLVRLKSGNNVIRGGAWCSSPEYCLAAFRNEMSAKHDRNFIGVRIVLQQQ